MRTISAQEITDTVARLCIEANTRLPQDVQAALDKARQEEPWPLAKNTLDLLWSKSFLLLLLSDDSLNFRRFSHASPAGNHRLPF